MELRPRVLPDLRLPIGVSRGRWPPPCRAHRSMLSRPVRTTGGFSSIRVRERRLPGLSAHRWLARGRRATDARRIGGECPRPPCFGEGRAASPSLMSSPGCPAGSRNRPRGSVDARGGTSVRNEEPRLPVESQGTAASPGAAEGRSSRTGAWYGRRRVRDRNAAGRLARPGESPGARRPGASALGGPCRSRGFVQAVATGEGASGPWRH